MKTKPEVSDHLTCYPSERRRTMTPAEIRRAALCLKDSGYTMKDIATELVLGAQELQAIMDHQPFKKTIFIVLELAVESEGDLSNKDIEKLVPEMDLINLSYHNGTADIRVVKQAPVII